MVLNHTFWLPGLVQIDDRSALLEITRQLQLENTVGDKVFVSIKTSKQFNNNIVWKGSGGFLSEGL